MRTGSAVGTVNGFVDDPLTYTRMSAKAGIHRLTGSVSSRSPRSHNIIAATEVIGFDIE